MGLTKPAPNCDYFGSNANREFTAVSGCRGQVPIERHGGNGTACGHWDEECMGRELMTGYSESTGPCPLSRITIGTLQDMGYQVDYSKADPYSRSDLATGCTSPIRQRREKERSLLDMKHGEVSWVLSVAGSRHNSGRTLQRLSAAGEAKAMMAGLDFLQTKAQDSNSYQVNDPRMAYVADKLVSVLFLEDGQIFSVTVRRPDK
jgi:Leishmanolysin